MGGLGVILRVIHEALGVIHGVIHGGLGVIHGALGLCHGIIFMKIMHLCDCCDLPKQGAIAMELSKHVLFGSGATVPLQSYANLVTGYSLFKPTIIAMFELYNS